MREALKRYVAEYYRQHVLHESVKIAAVAADPGTIDEIKAEIARIDALRLGANLAQRDFVSYQERRALEELLAALQLTATMRVTEAIDKAAFH